MKRLIEDIVGQRLLWVNFAWLSVIAGLGLGLIGVYAIDLAVHVEPGQVVGGINVADESAKQLVFVFVGMFAAGVVALPHYRWVRFVAWPMMWLTLGLLLFLLVPFVPASLVTPRNGARAWIDLGPVDFQPSEVAKIAFVLVLAEYLRFRRSQATVGGLLVPALICGVPVGLIILQPDLGTACLFVPSLFAMLLASGARLKHLVVIVAVAMLAGPLAYPLLKPHQKARIEGMIAMISGSREGADDINYQSITAMTLAGAGGVDGYSDRKARALMEYNHLPERHNDMVLAVILNRFGLLGGMVVMGLYAMWFVGAMLTAAMCKDPFGRLVVVGCAAILMVQMAINMGMTMGLLPIIGVTLPFVSYGGSSMLSVWLMTGLVMSVGLRPEPRLMQPAYEFGARNDG